MKLTDIKQIIKEEVQSRRESILLAKPDVITEANFGRIKRRIEDENCLLYTSPSPRDRG